MKESTEEKIMMTRVSLLINKYGRNKANFSVTRKTVNVLPDPPHWYMYGAVCQSKVGRMNRPITLTANATPPTTSHTTLAQLVSEVVTKLTELNISI